MSTRTRPSRFHRRALCTGEDVNAICRLRLPASRLIVPAAATAAQRMFEATLLLTWAGVTMTRSPSFISAVHPSVDVVTIRLAGADPLLPLLSQFSRDRVYVHRDYLELRLSGAQNEILARVRLTVDGRQEARALLDGAALPLRPPLGLDVPEPVAAALSAILRRFPLWRASAEVSVGVTDNAAMVSWLSGPSADAIAAILRDSCCAIPNVALEASSTGNVRSVLLSHAGQSAAVAGEPWSAWREVAAAPAMAYGPAVAPRLVNGMVMPTIWEGQEMRNALAAREVGTVYRFLRRNGVRQRQIAAMTGQSQSEVSEILKGRQVMAYDVLVRIADGLGVPRGYMGLAYDEVTAQRISELPAAPAAEEPESVKRRRFLARAAAIASGEGL